MISTTGNYHIYYSVLFGLNGIPPEVSRAQHLPQDTLRQQRTPNKDTTHTTKNSHGKHTLRYDDCFLQSFTFTKKKTRDGRRTTAKSNQTKTRRALSHTHTPGVFPDPRQWRAVVGGAPPRKAHPPPAASS